MVRAILILLLSAAACLATSRWGFSNVAALGYGPPPPPGEGSTLLDDLVSYWKLDESSGTMADETGANDLDVDVASPSSVSGKIGNALHIDNAADGKRIASPTGLGVPSGGVLTLAGWVQPKGAVADGDVAGLRTQYPDNIVWVLQTLATGSKFNLFLRAGGADFNVSSSTDSAAVDTWAFVLCEIDDAADEIRIQVNNGTAATTAFTGTPATATPAFQFGKPGSGSEVGSVCYCDEFGVWSRALTTDEKTELFNAGSGVTHPF